MMDLINDHFNNLLYWFSSFVKLSSTEFDDEHEGDDNDDADLFIGILLDVKIDFRLLLLLLLKISLIPTEEPPTLFTWKNNKFY